MAVFLSYSHEDEDFVRELYTRLKRDGVDCFFDKVSIGWGRNWVVELEKSIDRCSSIVLVLSPAFFKSEWSNLERTGAMADGPNKKEILPLMIEPCEDQIPRFLKPIQFLDITTNAKFEEKYPTICKKLGGTIKKTRRKTNRKKLPPKGSLPKYYRMPHKSLGNLFIGREKELWQIFDMLNRSNSAVIEGVGGVFGMGGLGKTQMAIEYAYRFSNYYPGGIFWIDAEDGKGAMINRITSVIEDLDIDEKLPEKERLEALWRGLNKLDPVLVILDNFTENENLTPWLPQSGSIHTLVTTRRKDMRKYGTVKVEVMTNEEGIALLSSGERSFGTEAGKLVEILGGLPLAIELAANYLDIQKSLSIEDMLEEIKKQGEIAVLRSFAEEYGDELPTGHTTEIVATFQLSWELASENEKTTAMAISLLAPTAVPLRLLAKCINNTDNDDLTFDVNNYAMRLNRLSLVELDDENDPIMHRLISAFIRLKITNESGLQKEVVDVMVNEMRRTRDEKDLASYRELEKVVPHAALLIKKEFTMPEQVKDIANYLSWHNRKQGRYRSAENFARKAVEICEKSYESGHTKIGVSQNYLRLILKDLGELDEAKELMQKALETGEKSYGVGQSEIAKRQSNLALILKDLGELNEAKELMQNVLESDKKSYEPGNPAIALSQSNLAMILADLGELNEAKELMQNVLESDEKSYEPANLAIATSQSNLASILYGLGKLNEAAELMQKAYDCFVKNFGDDHYQTKIVKGNLDEIVIRMSESK